MDENQIRLYILTKEPGLEADPRLALEFNHFIKSVLQWEQHFQRSPTPDQLEIAWQRWKTERIHYVNHVKQWSSTMADRLKTLALQHVSATEPNFADDRVTEEAVRFASQYALSLQHLSLEPLAEHIDAAWKAWKNGYTF